MEIGHGLTPPAWGEDPVYAAIGNFDGLHRGHRVLLRRLVRDARSAGARTLVMTFDPHPLAVLKPDRAPLLLTSLNQRAFLLRSVGIDRLQVIPFDSAFAAIAAEDFIRRILVDKFGVRCVFVGAFFAFGRGGRGTPELIQKLAPQTGCRAVVVDPVPGDDGGGAVSSTVVRRLVTAGRVEDAHRAMTVPLVLAGRVTRGEGRGRTIGFPTANLELPPGRVIPGHGVYAVWCCSGGRVHAGVANIGIRPTFGGLSGPNLEVHLLDWSGDLYGQELRVAFMHRLRGEQSFASVEALVAQIKCDIGQARRLLAAAAVDRGYLCLPNQTQRA
ncbi:MAG: bifunctional riboflavin kinase/FAD synthetase [Thermaerobacterales bacterium]